MITQPTTHTSQLIKLKFFYNPPQDNNFYYIECEKILEDTLDDQIIYNHSFFYYSCLIDLTVNCHVKCKLLSYPMIIDLLNKEVCEVEFYTSNSTRYESSLSLHQKLYLERSLGQKLDLYFLQYYYIDNLTSRCE